MGKSKKRVLKNKRHVVVIGPPGGRKTGISQIISKLTGIPVVIIDDEIVKACKKKTLEEVTKLLKGNFSKKEGKVAIQVLKNSTCQTIFDTGGSIIYSPKAMKLFKKYGFIIYLTASMRTLLKRIAKRLDRGIDMRGYSSLKKLLNSRKPKYKKWKDWTVSTEGNKAEVAKKIVKRLTKEHIVSKPKH